MQDHPNVHAVQEALETVDARDAYGPVPITGGPRTVFPTTFAELARVTGGMPADVA